jgi:membrane protein
VSKIDERRRTADGVEATFREPWIKGLGKVLVHAVKDFFHDSGPQWAAAIAYYSLLSTFPLLLAIASIAAFFVDPQWAVEQATNLLNRFLPTGGNQIESTVQEAIEARGRVSFLSIAFLLWAGSRVFGTVTKVLNIAYDTDETYSFLKRTLVELIILLTIGVLFVIALSSRFLINLLSAKLEFLPPGQNLLFQIALQAVPALLLIIAFFLLYRYVPNCWVDWRAALPGAGLAALLFLLARPVFLTYVEQFANYNLIYGSLAIVIILVIWAWIVAVITIFGGEVVSHAQAIMLEGQPAEEVEQRHKRRSPTHREARDEAPNQERQDRLRRKEPGLQERVKAAMDGQD